MDNGFGNLCDQDSDVDQCSFGLVCSQGSVDSETTNCLKDIGDDCGANSDCANNLFCVKGVCSCDVGVSISNCFFKLTNEMI